MFVFAIFSKGGDPSKEIIYFRHPGLENVEWWDEECLTWKSGAIRWPEHPGEEFGPLASVSDASHGQEEEYLPEEDEREAFRSQGGKLNFLASESMRLHRLAVARA